MMRCSKIFIVLLPTLCLMAFVGHPSLLMASSSQSHATHFVSDKGPHLPLNESGCYICHGNNACPKLADDKPLAETTVCDSCHSQGGVYDGVQMAKENWDGGVYESNGEALKGGKDQWCVSCHDGGTSVCDGASAPNVDLYYTSGHGRNGMVECLVCHDATFAHIDGQPRTYWFDDEDVDPADGIPDMYDHVNSGVEYAAGYRLRYVDGEVPFMIPADFGITLFSFDDIKTKASRRCFSCHDSSKILYDTFPYDSLDTNFKIMGSIHPPGGYSYGATQSDYNEHSAHVIGNVMGAGRFWDSDWDLTTGDSGGVAMGCESEITCVTCHNVHGAAGTVVDDDGTPYMCTNEPMIRDGRLVGHGGDANGTHTGGTHATVLTDSSASWTAGEFVNEVVENITDSSRGWIIANTANTVTVVALEEGSDNQWENGDAYKIWGRSDGYRFSYVKKVNANPWPPDTNPAPDPDRMVTSVGATQSNSIGAVFRVNITYRGSNMCGGGCHDFDAVVPPGASYDASEGCLEHYRAPVASGCNQCHTHSSEDSHTTHDDTTGMGVDLECQDCHDTSEHMSGTAYFTDTNPLSTTHTCDPCHSEDGAVDGVAEAKANWVDGVYETDGTLKLGKEQWCASCHDGGTSVVNGETAVDICGDNETYGYYFSAHGSDTEGVNHESISNEQGECVHCHQVSVGETTVTPPPSRIIDESFEGPGYQEDWTETATAGCGLDPDSVIPGTPPIGAGYQQLQSTSAETGYKAFATMDYGSEQSKTFTRMYLYVEDEGLASNDKKTIGALRDNADNNVFIFRLYKSGGQLQFNLRVYNNGSWNDYYANIFVNTWYRIEVKYDATNPSAPDAWEWRIDSETSQNNGSLTGSYHAGIQKWNLGFMVSSQTIAGTIYFDQVTVDNDDWIGAEPSATSIPHGGWLFATQFKDQKTGFCFKCHTEDITLPESLQVDMPEQYSYSHERGGCTDLTCPDDIKEAFSFIDTAASPQSNCGSSLGSAHYLPDVRDYMESKWGWGDVIEEIDPCMGCHNPHRAKSDWPCSLGSGHADTSTWQVWGDDSGEKMADYASGLGGVYQPPNKVGGGFEWTDAGQAPDYNTLCIDCHYYVVYSTRWGDLDSLGWFEEDNSYGNRHGARPREVGVNQGTLKSPYDDDEGTNYILICTDCHEPHGSENFKLLRTCVNGTSNLSIPSAGAVADDWMTWCEACHEMTNRANHMESPYGSPCNSSECHNHYTYAEHGKF